MAQGTTSVEAVHIPAPLRILGIAGSLRAGSFNRALLRAARETPSSMNLYDISAVPFYNADVEAVGDPDPVAVFKAAIRAADALLIATPEYNHGVPGGLRRIVWTGPPGRMRLSTRLQASSDHGGTAGRDSTLQAQSQPREGLWSIPRLVHSCSARALPLPCRCRIIPRRRAALTDGDTRIALHELLDVFVDW